MSRLKTDAIRNVNASVDGITLDTSGNVAIPNELQLADKIVHTGDTNTFIRFPAADVIAFETGGTERLRINSDGRIWVNTQTGSSATELLRVENTGSASTNSRISIVSGGAAQAVLLFGDDQSFDQGQIVYSNSDHSMRFHANAGNERFRIDSSGRVLIGLNSTSGVSTNAPLTIKSSGSSATRFNLVNSGSAHAESTQIYSQNQDLVFVAGGSDKIRIKNDGKVGIGTTSPATTLHLDSNGTPTTIQIDSDTESSIDFNDHGGSAKRYKIGTNISDNNGQFEFKDITASAERLRITSTGLVGIGTTTPSSKVQIQTHDHGSGSAARGHHNLLELKHPNTTTTGDGPALLLNGYYSNAEWKYAKISSENSGSGYGAKFKIYVHPSNGSQGANLVEALSINGDGSSGANVTITDGNLAVASGHGIDFSATSNASGMTSELLDDYEIGAWTPLIATTGTNFTSITNSSSGHYTKVGNVVTLTMYHRTDGITKGSASNSDHVIITGLPFTPSSNIQRCFVPIGFNPNWAEYPNQALIKESSTNIELYKYASAGGYNTGTRLTVAAVNTGGNANYCLVTMVYRT